MGYYNTANVRRFDSFGEVKAWFEKTKPIRGKPDMVPLGSRKHYYMARMTMPSSDRVSLLFYGEPLVTWFEDNTFIVRAPRYLSAYTPSNATPFLPHRLAFEWIDCQMFINVHGVRHPVRLKEELRFTHDESGKAVLLNPPEMVHIRLRRSAFDKVVEPYQPFLSWLQVVMSSKFIATYEEIEAARGALRMRMNIPPIEELRKKLEANRDKYWNAYMSAQRMPYADWNRGRAGSFSVEGCALFERIMRSDNADDWLLLLRACASLVGHVYRLTQGSGGYTMVLPYQNMYDVAADVIKFTHRDELFERVPVEPGETNRRTNQKYFNFHHFVVEE